MRERARQIERDLNTLQDLEAEFLNAHSTAPRIGYLCMRVPPEYPEAVDALPIRIVTPASSDLAVFSPLRTDACSFCRTVSTAVKQAPYNRLDAIIGGTCCDQMRRLLDTLSVELDIPVIIFGAPRTWQADADYFAGEMRRAFDRLSERIGRLPTPDQLRDSIHARNALKTRIRTLRQDEKLPTAVLHKIAASPLPAALLLSYLDRFEVRAPIPGETFARILLAGSIPAGWEAEMIASLGGGIIADATCLGDRLFHYLTAETGDPWVNLYDTYIEKNTCPHRRPVTPLFDYIQDIVVQSSVDGIIYRSVKYCHPWGLSAEHAKKAIGLPFLKIDDDLTSPAMTGFRTRIGAFIEMLNMRKVLRA